MVEVRRASTKLGGVWSKKAFQSDEFQKESYYMLSMDTMETVSQNWYCQVQTQKLKTSNKSTLDPHADFALDWIKNTINVISFLVS